MRQKMSWLERDERREAARDGKTALVYLGHVRAALAEARTWAPVSHEREQYWLARAALAEAEALRYVRLAARHARQASAARVEADRWAQHARPAEGA